MWRHIPNLISGLRLALVLPVFWLIGEHEYAKALLIAAVAGASDALDGYLAKRFGWQSRLGGLLDPLADKMLLLASFSGLTLAGALPAWLLLLVIGRDVLIVCGAVAYHNLIGAFEAAPSRLSKLTTVTQIACVLTELLRLAWWPQLPGEHAAIVVTAVLTAVSGLHYVIVWSARARRALNQRKQGNTTQ